MLDQILTIASFFLSTEDTFRAWEIQVLIFDLQLSLYTVYRVLIHPYFEINLISLNSLYNWFHIDLHYSTLCAYAAATMKVAKKTYYMQSQYTTLISFFSLVLVKYGHLSIMFYSAIFYGHFNIFKKSVAYSLKLVKVFALTETEKEIGALDDMIFFVLLFITTIFSFILCTVIVNITKMLKFSWLFSHLVILTIVILTIPLNVFYDFGISYAVYIKGSANSTNMFLEILFDLIATLTVFLRFIIQNIRYLFIYGAIFELFEFLFKTNSFFTMTQLTQHYLNIQKFNNILDTEGLNIIIINFICYIFYYIYYSLHLIF